MTDTAIDSMILIIVTLKSISVLKCQRVPRAMGRDIAGEYQRHIRLVFHTRQIQVIVFAFLSFSFHDS
jgi:hypothetical protein